jgi:hypothetical protein
VVMTRQVALGLMVTSPVMSPTSPNASLSSLYFWLLSALRGLVYTTRMRSLRAHTTTPQNEGGVRLQQAAMLMGGGATSGCGKWAEATCPPSCRQTLLLISNSRSSRWQGNAQPATRRQTHPHNCMAYERLLHPLPGCH